MITCPVCQKANHHLAPICEFCGCFLQQKIDNLNLFEMMWRMVESPRRAFQTIARARHKNYMIVLSSLAGVGFAFTLFWFLNVGDILTDLISLVAYGVSFGLFLGPIFILFFSIFVKLVTLFNRTKVRFRNIYSVSSYALMPVVATVFSLLPIELLTFGVYMFSRNPSPYTLKPFSYVIILGLDGLCALWTVILFVMGMRVLLDSGWRKAILVALCSLLAYFGLITGVMLTILSRIPIRL